MKITICGSMSFAEEMKDIAFRLETRGHTAILPNDVDDHIKDKNLKHKDDTSITTEKLMFLTKDHMNKIDNSDAILVLNYDKKGIKNYLGSSAFVETTYALANNKKIFFFNEIPDMPYISDDLKAFNITVINSDLDKII